MAGVSKIEVCINNLKLGSKLVYNQIRDTYPSIELKQWECLGHCDRCIRVPYVLIDDHDLIEAENAEELWEKVKTYINSKEES